MRIIRYAYDGKPTGLRLVLRLGGLRLRALVCLLLYAHHLSIVAVRSDMDTLGPMTDAQDVTAQEA